MLFHLHLASSKTSDKTSKQFCALTKNQASSEIVNSFTVVVSGHEMQDKQGWVVWLDYIVISNKDHLKQKKRLRIAQLNDKDVIWVS